MSVCGHACRLTGLTGVSGGQTSVCLPEQTDDDGAGEQSDERQAVAQSGQYLNHPVKDQLHTHGKHIY